MDQLGLGDRVSIKSLRDHDGIVDDFHLGSDYPIKVLPDSSVHPRAIWTTPGDLLRVVPEAIEVASDREPNPSPPAFAVGERVHFYLKRKLPPFKATILSYDPSRPQPYEVQTSRDSYPASADDLEKLSEEERKPGGGFP